MATDDEYLNDTNDPEHVEKVTENEVEVVKDDTPVDDEKFVAGCKPSIHINDEVMNDRVFKALKEHRIK